MDDSIEIKDDVGVEVTNSFECELSTHFFDPVDVEESIFLEEFLTE